MEAPERREVVERLRAHGWRGSILGPEGTGKTTLLEDIEASLRVEGLAIHWIRLNLDSTVDERREAARRVRRMGASECCFFDGGEVLGWLAWRRLVGAVKRNGCGLVATVHRPSPLPVIYRTEADPGRTVSLARELAGEHWTPKMEGVALSSFREGRGNAREVFRACYWHCATSER